MLKQNRTKVLELYDIRIQDIESQIKEDKLIQEEADSESKILFDQAAEFIEEAKHIQKSILISRMLIKSKEEEVASLYKSREDKKKACNDEMRRVLNSTLKHKQREKKALCIRLEKKEAAALAPKLNIHDIVYGAGLPPYFSDGLESKVPESDTVNSEQIDNTK